MPLPRLPSRPRSGLLLAGGLGLALWAAPPLAAWASSCIEPTLWLSLDSIEVVGGADGLDAEQRQALIDREAEEVWAPQAEVLYTTVTLDWFGDREGHHALDLY